MTNVFIFGSCVSRDQMTYLQKAGFQLIDYVARQSIISSSHSSGDEHLSEDLFSSKFQFKSLNSDLNGDLYDRISQKVEEIDLLLMDLTDERNGVLQLQSGNIITNNYELEAVGQKEILPIVDHLAFGTDSHFELWKASISQFAEFLVSKGLLRKTYVFPPIFAHSYADGTTDEQLSSAFDLEDRASRYEQFLKTLGFNVVPIHQLRLTSSRDHRWGPRPFHFSIQSEIEINRILKKSISRNLFSDTEVAVAQRAAVDFSKVLISDPFTAQEIEFSHDPLSLKGFFQLNPGATTVTILFESHVGDFGRMVSLARCNPEKSIVVLSDPTFSLGDLDTGWGQGEKSIWGLSLQVGAVDAISRVWKSVYGDRISVPNLILSGEAAGAFQAMAIAPFVFGSPKVKCHNPTFDWLRNVDRAPVLQLMAPVYGPFSNAPGFREKWAERISVFSLFEKLGYLPKLELFLDRSFVVENTPQYRVLLDFLSNSPLLTDGFDLSIDYGEGASAPLLS